MKGAFVPNEKLKAARLAKGWSMRRAADAVRVGYRVWRYWEVEGRNPSLYNLEALMNVFKLSAEELGYAHLVIIQDVTVASSTSRVSVAERTGEWHSVPLDSSMLTSVFDPITQFTVRILGLAGQWRGRAAFCAELQVLLSQEFAMFEEKSTSQSSFWEDHPFSRRQALVMLAALPQGLVFAAQHAGTKVVQEEFLPQCTTSITACWYLMQGREFLVVEQSLSQYLPALSALAQQSSPYQQVAASLASQGYFLLSQLALHRLRFRDRAMYSKQAAEYGKAAGDRSLQVSALSNLANAYFQLGDLSSQLQTYRQATGMLDGLPLVLQSKVLGGLAHAYAQQGQTQEVTRYLGEARIVLTSEAKAEHLPLYLAMDYGPVQAMQYEANAWLDLGDHLSDQAYYQQAAGALQMVKQLPSDLAIPERIKVELVNQESRVAVRRGELEPFRDLLVRGAQGAKDLASEKRRDEVITNWKAARKRWPQEPRIMELADLLLE
ncbi:MAG: helix-turn-helix domain-containing protein [Ktedonobacteraceae bacterium]